MSLCRIEVITSLAKFSSLKSALSKAGVRGMTVMQVLGCGVEKGTREYEVDENYEMELLPKQQISVVVKKEQVDKIVEVIKHELYTGHIGDGKIFIYDIDNHDGRRGCPQIKRNFACFYVVCFGLLNECGSRISV